MKISDINEKIKEKAMECVNGETFTLELEEGKESLSLSYLVFVKENPSSFDYDLPPAGRDQYTLQLYDMYYTIDDEESFFDVSKLIDDFENEY